MSATCTHSCGNCDRKTPLFFWNFQKAIKDYQRLPLASRVSQRLPKAPHGCRRLPEIPARGSERLPMASRSCQRLLMAATTSENKKKTLPRLRIIFQELGLWVYRWNHEAARNLAPAINPYRLAFGWLLATSAAAGKNKHHSPSENPRPSIQSYAAISLNSCRLLGKLPQTEPTGPMEQRGN